MKNQQLPQNDSFCIIPWVHQMVPGNGALHLCCHSGHKVGDYNQMEADWNNDTMRQIRADMVAGKPIPACQECVAKEQYGDYSPRLRYRTRWDSRLTDHRVIQSMENDYRVDELPFSMDIRFGNLCNLICKMCNPKNSTQIGKDYDELHRLDPEEFSAVLSLDKSSAGYDGVISEEQWVMYDRYIPYMRVLYLAGGEPTLSKDNIRLLKRCVELGYAHKIAITINTNITNINTDLLDVISQFGYVVIIASLDGINEVQEYIRYPSKWTAIQKNLDRIAAWTAISDKRFLTIAITVQVFNMLSLPSMFDHFVATKERNLLTRFKFEVAGLVKPPIMSVSNTSPLIRAIARIKLQKWLDMHPNADQWFYNDGEGIRSIIEMMKDDSGTDMSTQLLRYSRFVDQNKKAKLETNIPDLYRLLTRDQT